MNFFKLVACYTIMITAVSVYATENVVGNDLINTDKIECENPENKNCDGTASNVHEAPSYGELCPISGWDRYTADSAKSISEWKRWWVYLRMKKSVLMKWINDLKLKIYPSNEIFRAIYVRGIYDPNVIVITDALLPTGGTLIDVGSNMGYASLPLVKKLGNEGRIFAIEPSSRDYKRLVENVRMNGLDRVIKPMMVAIGDRKGTKTIQIAGEEKSGANTLGSEFVHKSIEKFGTENVVVTTIDDIVESEILERVDVIKLDIEGSEARALQGAITTMRLFKPAIIIAINNKALGISKRSTSDISKILKDNGYSVYKMNGNTFSVEKIEIEDLEKMGDGIVVCLPPNKLMPKLQEPKSENFIDSVKGFFS